MRHLLLKLKLTLFFPSHYHCKNHPFGLVRGYRYIKESGSYWWPPPTVHGFYRGFLFCRFSSWSHMAFFARVLHCYNCPCCSSVKNFNTFLCALSQDSSADVTDLLFCGRGWAECLLPCIPLIFHSIRLPWFPLLFSWITMQPVWHE